MSHPQDNQDSMENIMASVIHGERQKLDKKYRKKLSKLRRKKSRNYQANQAAQTWGQLDNNSHESAAYRRGVFGPSRRRNISASPRPRPAHITIAIQIPSQPFKRLRRWLSLHKKLIFIPLGIAALIALPFAGLNIWQQYKSRQDTNTATSPLKPEKVFLPIDLPAGYEVVSTNESLENGAMVYRIYNPEGQIITITQQAKPDDFDMKTFASVPSFNTPYGKAYILEDAGRINGYIFDEKTWVLFNSTARIEYDSMKELMLGLKPSEE